MYRVASLVSSLRKYRQYVLVMSIIGAMLSSGRTAFMGSINNSFTKCFVLNMLLICPTFYCLSNIVLLICFSILAYRQLRGLVLILYDNNQILDQIDKGLYCLCLVASLTVIGITVYPVESLMLLLKGFKMAT